MEIEIKLKTDKQEIHLDYYEARELFQKLKGMFEDELKLPSINTTGYVPGYYTGGIK